MIYDAPIYRPLGDCYLAVEFGDGRISRSTSRCSPSPTP
jgi:hypothetical protein